jgi:hypothetical protein
MIIVYGFALYALIGFVVALGFVTVGISRVLPHASATVGARILILPGATALWPYVLTRWLKSPGAA